MSVKENWKQTGNELGKSFAGLGDALLKTIEVGSEMSPDGKVRDSEGNVVETGLKEEWAGVGKGFVRSGIVLGKATASTAKLVIDKVSEMKAEAAREEEKPVESTEEEEPKGEDNV